MHFLSKSNAICDFFSLLVDFCVDSKYQQFTIIIHHGGVFKGGRKDIYVRGTVTCFDYCHVDEISLIELANMASEVGEYTTVDFYRSVNGYFSTLKCDTDVI